MDREAALDRLTDAPVDVLVIGGGITGVGIALDAVTRGYSVGLIERDDLASGTSSRSSKLIHGGVRYLEQGDVALVYEAARERERLRRLAPHLVRPLGFVVPTDDTRAAVLMRAGLVIYDGMLGLRNVRRHQRLQRDEVLTAAPGLLHGAQRGGYLYVDCRTDDARLTLAIAQQARRYGAAVANYTGAVGLLRAGERVVGARVQDRLTGDERDVHARWTVSATGVWADEVRGLASDRNRGWLTPSKGVHLVLRAADVPIRQAVIIESGARDRRRVFLVPWGAQVYVGTTDEHHRGDLDHAAVDPPETGYLLHAVNASFGTELGARDVVGAWAGLRPLVSGDGAAASKDLSRRHAIFEDPPGLVTITGGKLTTYRQMAEDLVDRLAASDGNRRGCATARLPLGARGTLAQGRERVRAVARTWGVPTHTADALYARHGDDAPTVLSLAVGTSEADPLIDGLPYLLAEVRWAVRHEMARTLDDVLQRRLRVSLRHAGAGGGAIDRAAQILAEELGWSADEQRRQIGEYLRAVESERGVVPVAAVRS